MLQGLERNHGRLGDFDVTDPFVDRVRGRVGQVGVEEAEAPAAVEQGLREPGDERGRGYATALVAEQSQKLLDAGRRFCFLYTDLANPTSNAIYERIGYVKIAESAMVEFGEQ